MKNCLIFLTAILQWFILKQNVPNINMLVNKSHDKNKKRTELIKCYIYKVFINEPSHAKYIFPKCFNSIINNSPDKNVLNSIEWTEDWYHTIRELDHEIIYMVILLTFANSRKGCCQLQTKACA